MIHRARPFALVALLAVACACDSGPAATAPSATPSPPATCVKVWAVAWVRSQLTMNDEHAITAVFVFGLIAMPVGWQLPPRGILVTEPSFGSTLNRALASGLVTYTIPSTGS